MSTSNYIQQCHKISIVEKVQKDMKSTILIQKGSLW